MKTLFFLTAIVLMFSPAFTQTSNPCVSCNNNVIDTANYSSAIGSENISTGLNSFAGGFQSEAFDSYSIALGRHAQSTNANAISIGKYTEASGISSFSIGTFLKSNAGFSFIIGKGASNSQRLENNKDNSLIVGFNSTLPTLFVGSSAGSNYTGKVGIGNITEPEAKLHIRSDINEDASIMLQPSGTNYYAKLLFGENGNQISAKANEDLKFNTVSGNDFVFENGNIGIDTEDPIAKVQVKNGDIFIEDINRGIVMKSPDGNCWRGTLDNSGMLNFVQVDCNDLLTGSLDQSDRTTKLIHIYPNPTGSKLFISIDQELTGSILEITNINGKILAAEILAKQESCIDMSSYSKGIYVYTVKNNNGIIDTGKVVKE